MLSLTPFLLHLYLNCDLLKNYPSYPKQFSTRQTIFYHLFISWFSHWSGWICFVFLMAFLFFLPLSKTLGDKWYSFTVLGKTCYHVFVFRLLQGSSYQWLNRPQRRVLLWLGRMQHCPVWAGHDQSVDAWSSLVGCPSQCHPPTPCVYQAWDGSNQSWSQTEEGLGPWWNG